MKIETIKQLWFEKPLVIIVVIAIVLRLIAAIFARGFGMQDDHFLVIEPAQSWAEGGDYSGWLPWSHPGAKPSGHSFFYAGLHFIFFKICGFLGIVNPDIKMFLVRLIHAAWSMITVILGYKIALHYGQKKAAAIAGLMLAGLWFFPWASVRNLVEMACIPFLIWGTWLLSKNDIIKPKHAIYAGLLIGLAFSIRFQTIFFALGSGLALLYSRQWKAALLFGVSYWVSLGIVQGGIDWFVWGRPFAEFMEYVRYNIENANNYFTGEWYNYILLISGVLIPPVSLLIFFGLFARFKRQIIVALPTVLFLAFHSWFPNKQERFIFPIIPFVIIAGVTGWFSFSNNRSWWLNHKKLHKNIWVAFWVINILLLPVVTVMYSKKAKVEAMEYISTYPGIKTIILDGRGGSDAKILPAFYSRQWPNQLELENSYSIDSLSSFMTRSPWSEPGFVMFFANDKMPERLSYLRHTLPNLEFEVVIQPGFVDKFMHWLNPYNANETIVIFRNTKIYPVSLRNANLND